MAHSISLTLTSVVAGRRNDVTAAVNVLEDGAKFFSTIVTWHDVPDVGVDGIEAILEDYVGKLPYSAVNASRAEVLLFQRKMAHALGMLNLIGDELVGADQAAKEKATEDLVAKRGKKPKKRR
jgi:hypothetical protein